MHRGKHRILGELIQANEIDNVQPFLTYKMAILYGSIEEKIHRDMVDAQDGTPKRASLGDSGLH